jgi:bifunctional non-homologous end joining protein LigD
MLYLIGSPPLSGMLDRVRRDPLEVRKATLASIVAKAGPGIRFNEHIEGDGPTVFVHACKLSDWLKMKNADAPAVKREAEEDWGKGR